MRRPVRGLVRAVFRSSNIPTAIAIVVMVAAGVFAERQNFAVHEQAERSSALDQLSLVRAQIEGKVASNIQLVHGLVSTIITEPDMTQERFTGLATHLFEQENQLRNVAAAPDLVVEMVHPLQDNRAALGLDYNLNAEQRDAALRARDSGEMVMAGPVHLVQGGRGFIGRFPVFYEDAAGDRVFWGIVSAVIDADRLYAESGLLDPDLALDIAMLGRDGIVSGNDVFYGNPAILDQDPIHAEIVLPSGRWQMAAIPSGGWSTAPPDIWQMRAIIGFAAALVLVPIILAGRLNEERRRRMIEQKRRETELARLSRRLELALATSKVGVWEMNIATGHLSWDDRMNELYGLPMDGGVRDYTHWRDAVHPDDLEQAERDFNHSIRSGERYLSNFRVLTRTGVIRHIRAIGAVYKEAGASARIVGVNWDVTADAKLSEALMRAKTQAEAKNFELENTKARIEHNALHDPLTGLPNRRYLDDVLELHASRATKLGGSSSILHIDLDRFKQINDTLGHAAGDAMLVHAAEILKSSARRSDFVARIGGDEFVIFCVGTRTERELCALSERVISTMSQPVSYQGHECRFGVSIGIASSTDGQTAPKQLLINADIALYRAKRRGRNRHEFFSEELQAEIVTTKRIADDILTGLENDEFVAHYQPQFDARTLDIVGIEALARWYHPLQGELSPAAFMTTAEDLNVVATLDRIVLEQAIAQRREWEKMGLSVPRVSVNVSARRLNDEGLIDSLKAMDIVPGTVSFELVESIYLDESDSMVSWNIDQIRELGIDIEIDDFGTGYASIVSLLQLRPNRLKIDRQLVAPVTESEAQKKLVQSIIEIGASLGIEAVAEGIETPEHIRILRECGCSILQGFAFAKPMAPDEATRFIRSQSWRETG